MIHRHVILEDGRPRAAQVYPEGLCKAICEGLHAQLEADRRGQFTIASLKGTARELHDVQSQMDKEYKMVEEDYSSEVQKAWDDVTGAELVPAGVKVARQEEIGYIKEIKLYRKVDVQECWRVTGNAPIRVRWIDISKGDTKEPKYRSRLVAKEINRYKRDDLFAATPPLEALKVIISATTIGNKGEIIMINDVSRAFFHAKVKRDVYVALPDEDMNEEDVGKCAKLEYSMYGTRDAAINWHDEYTQQLVQSGFAQGKASPCVFYHPARKIRTCVHGHDYVSSGSEESLKWMESQLKNKYEIKTKWLGPKAHHEKEVKILNRVVSWTNEGIKYEADPRHAELMIQEMKLNESKDVVTPGIHDEGETSDDKDQTLEPEKETAYRALVARANYISPDRPDISFAVK